MNTFSKQNHNFDKELVRKVVNYAKGIPLVLEVLAGLLRGKDKEIWESHLEKLEKMPHKEVHDIMRLSYDGLDCEEQNIFLDIACFFHGLNLKLEYIRLLLKDDYSVTAGIETLKDKALITISRHNIVPMHDIVQETALEIVREQPSNQRRFWDPNVVYHLLENKDLESLKVVSLRNSTCLTILPDFSKAKNLEVLDLRLSRRLASVHTSVFGLKKLKTLDLGGCFSLRKLRSNIHLSSLRYLSLSGCFGLKDFSVTSENLEVLNLGLTGINQLPSSIGRQRKLENLSLSLSDIESLPESIKNLTRLRYLDISYCSNLKILPELPPSLVELDASGCTSLKTVLMFPSSTAHQLKENKKLIVFWNCLYLDQRSLGAIGLDAQIYLMKIAYNHLSALAHDYYKDDGTHAVYVYPGSQVPEWLVYRTKRNYVNIDICSATSPHSPLLGFVFCFIVPQVPLEGATLTFT